MYLADVKRTATGLKAVINAILASPRKVSFTYQSSW